MGRWLELFRALKNEGADERTDSGAPQRPSASIAHFVTHGSVCLIRRRLPGRRSH